MSKANAKLNLRKIFRTVAENIRIIIAVPAVCVLAGAFITMFLIPPIYRASSMLIVNSQNNPSSAAPNTAITSEQLKTASELVSTYSIIITSDTVLDKVIDNLELRKYDSMEDITAEKLAKRIDVSAVNETQVMKISVNDKDEALAKAINAEIVNVSPEIIINTVKAGSVEIISPAKSYGKVSPSLSKNTALCFAMGFVIALLIVFFKSMFDNTISTKEDIDRYLNLSVLGVVPKAED